VQALRAGFELIEAVKSLGLGIRIGVCTGDAVVRGGQPYGPSIHLAARLQKIAAPGTMLVGELTKRSVGDRFQFEGPEAAEQVAGERLERLDGLVAQLWWDCDDMESRPDIDHGGVKVDDRQTGRLRSLGHEHLLGKIARTGTRTSITFLNGVAEAPPKPGPLVPWTMFAHGVVSLQKS
jgi:hypothetical protein